MAKISDPNWQWYTQSQARGMFWLTVKREIPEFLDELAAFADTFDGGFFPYKAFEISKYFEPFLDKHHIHYESKEVQTSTMISEFTGTYEYTQESWFAKFILLTAAYWRKRPKNKNKRILHGQSFLYLNNDVNQEAIRTTVDPYFPKVSHRKLLKAILPILSPEELDRLDKRYWQNRVSEKDYENSLHLNFEFSVEGWDWQRGHETEKSARKRMGVEAKKIIDQKISDHISKMEKDKTNYMFASTNEFRTAVNRFFSKKHTADPKCRVDNKEYSEQSNKILNFIGLTPPNETEKHF